jgi:arachidonate 15-lipoxygenase
MAEYLISQDDPRVERAEQLAALRGTYRYAMDYGFPVSAEMQEEDSSSGAFRRKALTVQEGIRLNLQALKRRGRWNFVNELPPLAPVKLASMIRNNDRAGLIDYFMPNPGGMVDDKRTARSIKDFEEIFAYAKPPAVISRYESDAYFVENMVAGPDPTRLVRMTRIPDKFPITSEHLRSVPELSGEDLESAVATGRVYWVDHEVMTELENGAHPQSPKYIYAPMVAFCMPRHGGPLLPFAIQCGQDPAGRDIYTPADGYSWRLAKNCVLAAHNTYQEVLTHLGFTHLVAEAVLVSMVRNLAVNHPVAVLLRRHFEGTMSINKLAVDLLIQPDRAVDYLIGPSLKSTYPWLAKHRANYSFSGNYLPTRIARAGTGDITKLESFPYRDDGMLLWGAIRNWVHKFVEAYYPSDMHVLQDLELQAWAAEAASEEGGRIRDFGATPGHIGDRQDLAEILTMVIWIAGPQHAAVNFSQQEHMTFLPANPLAGFTPEPTGKDHTAADWLANLPPLDVAMQQFCIMTLLGSVHYTTLGDYQHDFKDTPADRAHTMFLKELTSIEDEIVARNQRRSAPYIHLQPSLIPNSINI